MATPIRAAAVACSTGFIASKPAAGALRDKKKMVMGTAATRPLAVLMVETQSLKKACVANQLEVSRLPGSDYQRIMWPSPVKMAACKAPWQFCSEDADSAIPV